VRQKDTHTYIHTQEKQEKAREDNIGLIGVCVYVWRGWRGKTLDHIDTEIYIYTYIYLST